MKVLCIGHLTYDTTLKMDAYPDENEKYHLHTRIECGGGAAANAGYLLSKWGMEVYIAGVAGKDYLGEEIKKEFNDVGANTKYIQLDEGLHTDSSYIIANTSNGSRTILTACDDKTNHKLNQDIEENFDYIILDGDDYKFAEEIMKKNPNAITILDAGNLREGIKALAPKVDYLVCSHDFAEDYTNMKMDYNDRDSIIRIYDKLSESFSNKIIITLEATGSFTKINNKYETIPSIKIEHPVDSTGAGDIFHGAFAYFLMQKMPLEEILLLSNITGALSVEHIGGRYSMPKLEEVLSERKKLDIL